MQYTNAFSRGISACLPSLWCEHALNVGEQTGSPLLAKHVICRRSEYNRAVFYYGEFWLFREVSASFTLARFECSPHPLPKTAYALAERLFAQSPLPQYAVFKDK